MVEYTDNMQARLDFLNPLQMAARQISLNLYGQSIDIKNKAQTGYDPVTQADIQIENHLRTMIRQRFPEDSIHGEEFPDYDGTSQWLWTLDPIDGTRAFIVGVPVWSTLIAVSYKQVPCLGLIDVAGLDMAFWGAPKQAWKITRGQRSELQCRNCRDLNQAILGCTDPLALFTPEEFNAYNKIRAQVRFSRQGLDAFGYALVACGHMDVIMEASLKPCDVRALIPVIEGAGGCLTNWRGGSARDGGHVLALGDKHLFASLSPLLDSD